ncbi:MAG: MFS transporter [Candidatus Wallbacteria bacterium]|nr:MFS transporter [Candidatus Wallbacteria bacterium]
MEQKTSNLIFYEALFWLVGFVGATFMTFGPLFLDRCGCKGETIGLFFTLSSLAGFVSMNVWGPVFDRFPRARAFVVFGLAADIGILVGLIRSRDPYFMICSFSLIMLLEAFFPAAQAAITFLFPDQKGRKLGQLFCFESAGFGTACLAGVIIFAAADILEIFLIFRFALFISVILLVLSIFVPLVNWVRIETLEKRSLLGQIALLKKNRQIAWFGMLLFWVAIGNSMFFAYFSVYFKRVCGGTESMLGISLLLATIFGALVYPFYGWLGDRLGPKFLLNLSATGYFLGFAPMIFIRDPLLVIIIYSLPFYPALRIAGNLFVSNHTEESERGTGIGLIESLHALGMVIAPLLSGILVHFFGYASLPLGTTLFFSVYYLIYIAGRRHLTKMV